jgi:hypothetical protein
MQFTCNVTVGRICITIYHGTAISVIYSKCMYVAIVIQHTEHLCLITLSSLACLAVQYFPTLSHKWQIFGKSLLHIKCEFLMLSKNSVWNSFHSTKNWVRYYYQCAVIFSKVPAVPVRFNETWMFLTQFWEMLKYQISCKSVQGEISCSMWTDGWTGRHGEAVVALCSFANMPVRLAYIEVQRWVKNYPQCRYMLCSWWHCWLGMMQYVWSACLLLLWCRCDLDSRFMSWVLCHKLGQSTFHLHQRRAEGSDTFFMGWRCTKCWNA